MRSYCFLKYTKSNQHKTMCEWRAENDATRTRVAYADNQSKAVAEAVRNTPGMPGDKAAKLWADAKQSVVEFDNDEADDNAQASDKEDYFEYKASD